MKEHLKGWNFKKHLTVVSAFYGICYLIDMTLGFIVAKKVLGKLEAQGKLDCKCKKKFLK